NINELASTINEGFSFVPNKFISNRLRFVAYIKSVIDEF
ncbi:hypothetical protein M081_3927, partial [Bacteroides fragilis str. 3998 T(B) 4]